MLTELYISSKFKTILALLLLYFIVVETDNKFHVSGNANKTAQNIDSIAIDSIKSETDSLKMILEESIKKAEKEIKVLHKICNKKS